MTHWTVTEARATGDVPPAVLDHPSMMRPEEKAVLYHAARDDYTGAGVIVDAGIFLGASTAAFAQGIADNPRARPAFDRPVHSYDIAIWVNGMEKYLSRPAFARKLRGFSFTVGESFADALPRLLDKHMDRVDLRIGDIRKARESDPVEIAFYDCLKTYDRDLAVFRIFAPRYIPGRTLVIQQDYFYRGAPDHKVRQEALAPWFDYLGHVEETAIFRLARPLPPEVLSGDIVAGLGLEERVALIDQAAARPGVALRDFATRLSAVELLRDAGEIAAARARIADLREMLDGSPGREPDFWGERLDDMAAALDRRA